MTTADSSIASRAQNDNARELWIVDLGRRAYGEVLELQRAVARARISGDVDQDVLLLVEHHPVITLGRSSKDAHLLANAEQLAARGVELFEVERGGDVTFHGPGQLVDIRSSISSATSRTCTGISVRSRSCSFARSGNWASRASASRSTPACGRGIARSLQSACTRATGSRGTALRSTS